jgi:hypothetical protein
MKIAHPGIHGCFRFVARPGGVLCGTLALLPRSIARCDSVDLELASASSASLLPKAASRSRILGADRAFA